MLGEDFLPYFQPFMAYAMEVLSQPYSKALALLIGKTMECVGLMCGTLPKENCKTFVVPVVEQMIRMQV